MTGRECGGDRVGVDADAVRSADLVTKLMHAEHSIARSTAWVVARHVGLHPARPQAYGTQVDRTRTGLCRPRRGAARWVKRYYRQIARLSDRGMG